MKIDFLLPTDQQARPIPLALQMAGRIADEAARRRLFQDYHDRRSGETRRQQAATLAAFRVFLASAAADPGDLFNEPDAWQGVTWGLVSDFIRAQLAQGYAVATVNSRLATLKRYASLAIQAGTLPHEQYAMIRAISGYSRREARHLDQQREAAGLATRTGRKAAAPVELAPDQIKALKAQPDTPQGRRDAFLMCLLLDHGLRCSELAGLRRRDLRLAAGELRFFRPKVSKIQTHQLTRDTQAAARLYLAELDPPDPDAPLLAGSLKSGQLAASGLGRRSINERVRVLGQRVGVEGLSPHDCRHTAATLAARRMDVKQLCEVFGWNSPAMAMRYIRDSVVVKVE